MSLYRIPTPDLSQISVERKSYISEKLWDIYRNNQLERYSDERYLAWEKVRYLELPPELQSHEELWYVIRLFRFAHIVTPVKNIDGSFFTIKKVNFLEELLHNLDLSLGGTFLGTDFTKDEKKIFLQNGAAAEFLKQTFDLPDSDIARALSVTSKKPLYSEFFALSPTMSQIFRLYPTPEFYRLANTENISIRKEENWKK